jgi:hypothetical protein
MHDVPGERGEEEIFVQNMEEEMDENLCEKSVDSMEEGNE